MIKKIPGPKKPMGSNLEIVLLFQAAQIQRLTQNLQLLNNYRRQMEKGPMNLKSMEIQIKELTDQIFRKEKEISIMKQKYEAALKNLSQFDISNQELQKKLREKLIEVRQIKEELYEKDLTVSESQKFVDQKQIYIKKLNDSIFFLSKDRDELQQKNDQYLDKLALLSQEMVRLRESNNKMKSNRGSLESQVDELKKQNFGLKSLLEKQRLENQQLHIMSQRLSQQIQEFKSTIQLMRDNQEHMNMEKSSHLLTLQHKNQQFFNENNRLKSQIMQLQRSLSQKDHVAQELHFKLQKSIEQTSAHKQQTRRLNEILNQQEEDFNVLKEHFRELQYNLQSQKSYHSQEVSNFEVRQREIEQKREQEIVKREGQIKELRRQNQHLNGEISRLAAILQKISQEKSSLNTTLSTNIQQLNRQVQQRELIIRQKQQQLTELQRTIQHLSITSRQNIQNQSSTIKELGQTVQQLKETNLNLRQELNRAIKEKQQLIGEISNKEMSQSSINMRYETLLRDIENRNEEIASLTLQLQHKNHQLQSFTHVLNIKHRQIQQLRNEIYIYSQSISQKQRLQHDKQHYFQQKITDFQQTQQQYIERQKRLLTDLKLIETKIQQKQKQTINLKQRTNALENQLNLVTHELQRLSIILREKDQLLVERMDQIHSLTRVEQETKLQLKSLRQVISKKDYEMSTKQAKDTNSQQKLLSQLNQVKRLVISKDEQLLRCNQYILNLNEKVSQLTSQQSALIKQLENSSRSNGQSNQDNRDACSRILELLMGIKEQTARNMSTVNRQLEQYHTVQQNNHYSIQQQYSHIQGYVENRSEEDTRSHQLHHSIQQRQLTIQALEKQLLSLRHLADNDTQYNQLLQELHLVRDQNQTIKQLLTQIHLHQQHNHLNQIQHYKLQLQHKSTTLQQLNAKLNLIETDMQKLLLQLQHYQNLQQSQLPLFQSSKQQAIDKAIQQTQYKADKSLKALEQQLLNQINAIKSQNHTLTQQHHKLTQINQTLSEQNQTLSEQNKLLEKRLDDVETIVNQKKQEILEFHEVLMKNNEDYVRKNQLQKFNLQNQIKLLTQQNHHYSQTITSNQQQTKKLQENLHEKDQQLKRLKSLKKRVQELQQQIYQMLQDKNNASVINQQQLTLQLQTLKSTINQLQSMNRNLHSRLQQALGKLSTLSQHLAKLQADQSSAVSKLQALVQVQAKYEEALKQLEAVQLRKSELEMLLTKSQSEMRQLLIEKEFNDKTKSSHNLVLTKYESKLKMLISESEQFSYFIQLLQSQNLDLKKTNTTINLELKKAQLAQQKIRILNKEIERLSIQKIDLDSELTTYKLQFSEESSVQRRNQEQLCLMVLLFAQIQALRTRLRTKEQQVQVTHRSYRRSISSSRNK